MERSSKRIVLGPVILLLVAGVIGISSFYFSRAEEPPPMPRQVIYEPTAAMEGLG